MSDTQKIDTMNLADKLTFASAETSPFHVIRDIRILNEAAERLREQQKEIECLKTQRDEANTGRRELEKYRDRYEPVRMRLAEQDKELASMRKVCMRIGSICYYGNFRAETASEKGLEDLLRGLGYFFETEKEILEKIKEIECYE